MSTGTAAADLEPDPGGTQRYAVFRPRHQRVEVTVDDTTRQFDDGAQDADDTCVANRLDDWRVWQHSRKKTI